MQHGTNIRFQTNGFRIAAPNPGANRDSWTDLRMSLPMVSHIGLYRDPQQECSREIGAGAAIWLEMTHDSTTISEVRVALCTYGLLSTCFTDTIRINSLHTADVDFPVYFAGSDDPALPGHKPEHWANSLNDCCFADGDRPCLIKATKGFNHFGGWQLDNVHIVRQGRKKGVGPESCNLYWTGNGGRIRGGIIKDPGHMITLNDGGSYVRKQARIDADGMILGGSRNVIDSSFLGASEAVLKVLKRVAEIDLGCWARQARGAQACRPGSSRPTPATTQSNSARRIWTETTSTRRSIRKG
jgi:hypothetical protein